MIFFPAHQGVYKAVTDTSVPPRPVFSNKGRYYYMLCHTTHTKTLSAARVSAALWLCSQRDINQQNLTWQWCPLKQFGISYQDIISFDKKLDVEWARDGKSLCDLSGSILHLDQKDNDTVLKNIPWFKQTKNVHHLKFGFFSFLLQRTTSLQIIR